MSNNKHNNQVTLMAIACVSVIAVTMMVLTAMMNVVNAQFTVVSNGYRTSVVQEGGTYYVNTSRLSTQAEREAAHERRVAQVNKRVARDRRKANRCNCPVLSLHGVYVYPDSTSNTELQVSRSLEERFQYDVKLDTRMNKLNTLYGAVLAVCAYSANNNGNDAAAIKVAKVTLGTAFLTNIVNRGRRRQNAQL